MPGPSSIRRLGHVILAGCSPELATKRTASRISNESLRTMALFGESLGRRYVATATWMEKERATNGASCCARLVRRHREVRPHAKLGTHNPLVIVHSTRTIASSSRMDQSPTVTRSALGFEDCRSPECLQN